MKASLSRFTGLKAATAAVLALGITLVIASPASARTVETYKNFDSGHCLDADWTGHVYGIPCNGGLNQEWQVGEDNNAVQLKNVGTGQCLDSNGEGVYTLGCNGSDNQRWYVGHSGDYIGFRNVVTWRCLWDENGIKGKPDPGKCEYFPNGQWS